MMEQWGILAGFAFVFILFLFLHTRYQGLIERKLLVTRIHSTWLNLFTILLHGLLAGFVASLLITALSLHFTLQTMIGVFVLSLLLSLIHIRFISFFYAASISSLLAMSTQFGYIAWDSFGLSVIQQYFLQIEISSLLALSGILYLVEAALLSPKRQYGQVPTIYLGHRGRLIGGFLVQRLWFIPLLVLMPSVFGLELTNLPSWWPLFANNVNNTSDAVSFLPVMLGFSSIVIGRQASEVIRTSRNWLVLAGIIIVGFSYVSLFATWAMIVAALIALAAHEVLILIIKKSEQQAKPYFSHSDQGLMILSVLPGSPAAEMGVLPGERIARVNGEQVSDTKELYAALQQNAAFCKLEIVNLAGNVKYVQRSLYHGEHYLLGIILAPDIDKKSYLQSGYMNLFHLLSQKVRMRMKKDSEVV